MLASALFFAFGLSLTSFVNAATAGPWQQCGGITYKGPIECDPGYTCIYQNDYYSQCIPSATTTTTTKGTTTTTTTKSTTTTTTTKVTTTTTSTTTKTTTTTTATSTGSSSSSTKTATVTCPYAIPRATGTPIGAITTGTPFYGYYLQRDSSTNEAILIPDPYAPEIYWSASIYRMEYVTSTSCVSRVYLNIYQPSPSTLSYKPLKWTPNMGLTFSWDSDSTKVLQTVATNNGYTTNWGAHDWFVACLQDGKWKVYLQTGTDVPTGVTCVPTQLKLGLIASP